MTGDLLTDSAISLGAILLIVLATRLAFRHQSPLVTEAVAAERLAFDEPDFDPARWLFDDNWRGAVAESDSGEYAIIVRLGADLVTRRFKTAQASVKDNELIIRPPDPGGVTARILAPEAADWARKISSN